MDLQLEDKNALKHFQANYQVPKLEKPLGCLDAFQKTNFSAKKRSLTRWTRSMICTCAMNVVVMVPDLRFS